MRVAFAARPTKRASAGMRAYANELLARIPRVAPDIDLVAVRAPVPLQSVALRLARVSLVHVPYLEAPPLLPRPYVAMLHDAIHLRYPKLFSPATAMYWRTIGRALYRDAARVLVGDPRVARDAVDLIGVDPKRVVVVALGYADNIPDAAPFESERPYAMYAGNHAAHKDLETLCAAWAALPPSIDLDLVMTGADEPALRAAYRREGNILRFLGDLDGETLARRYRGALVYVQPSLVEGFGIPALDAAVGGTPVIATTTSLAAPLRDVATTFEPGDTGALAAAMEAIARDPGAARARAGAAAVALREFTWDRCARETAAVYRDVLATLRS